MLSPKFKKNNKELLDNVKIFRRKIPEKELKLIAKKFEEFESKEENAEKIFVAEKKAFIIIETPEAVVKKVKDEKGNTVLDKKGNEKEEIINSPKNPKPDSQGNINDEFFIWRNCKFKLGEITVMGNVEEMDLISTFGLNAFVSGSFKRQFMHTEETDWDNSCSSLTELINNYYDKETAAAIKAGDIKITEGVDYNVSNSITLYQVIETW